MEQEPPEIESAETERRQSQLQPPCTDHDAESNKQHFQETQMVYSFLFVINLL